MIIITENIFQVIKHYSHSFTLFTKCPWNGDGLNHMLTIYKNFGTLYKPKIIVKNVLNIAHIKNKKVALIFLTDITSLN